MSAMYPRFDAIVASLKQAGGPWGAMVRNDAGFTPFVARSLEYFLTREFEVPLEELPLINGGVIPINREVPEGAKSFTYTVVDGAGIAEFYEHHSQGSLPMATVFAEEFNRPTHVIAMGYEMSREDIRNAQFANVPLRDRLNERAVRGMLEKHELVGMYGDVDRDLHGFANHPNVPDLAPSADSTGDTNLYTKEGAAIVQDFTNAYQTVRDNTACTREINSVAVPEDLLTTWAGRDYTPDASGSGVVADGRSILDQLRARFPNIAIGSLCRLQANRSLGNLANDTVIFYLNGDQDVVSYVLPMDPSFYDPQWYEHVMKVPGDSKTGGVDWKEPMTAVRMIAS